MNFNNHWELEGKHAFLSPSQYHWIRYDDDKLIDKYHNFRASERGVRLHDLATECILLGVKLPRTKNALNCFVNDAIGYKMTPDQVLYYSPYCFGTADAISFRKNLLRIHDYKSGVTKTSMDQLLVYAAIFCLEYGAKPSDIEMELRIYQSDEVLYHIPDLEEIVPIIDKIIYFDKIISGLAED